MDLSQEAQAVVLVTLRECHLHCVGVERRPKHSGLLQKAPHNPAPSLAAHEPLDVTLLNIAPVALALFQLVLCSRLGVDVEGVVIAHAQRLGHGAGGRCTACSGLFLAVSAVILFLVTPAEAVHHFVCDTPWVRFSANLDRAKPISYRCLAILATRQVIGDFKQNHCLFLLRRRHRVVE